ncbi:uncharacterized protein J4E84_008814 [Alternaria hordeiaustralica]|uniref:uncharacterized protein n=1 Tax=Alternaria hordeiaustralica TaxID=1187925 RepID=UPI0020C211D8|nr:uncharacterized protein J4E84_008814 [Alternaria hordeiaustralica]KAI4677869.1 hypothetical protein J4E84_008814 [Alternaria hordeiaustralica]
MFAPKKEMFLPVGTKHENIMWEKEMKERIMSHARIVYADKLSPSSHFDIITALDKSGGTSRYRAHLLVINAPIGTDYKVVFSAHARNSVGDGLESMLEILQQKVAPLLSKSLIHISQDWLIVQC